ncbi:MULTISPECIES: helix-turn-helix transcriptional regulator [Protofrankia]|nr:MULTISPECIES: helix-turn-helix transcriptional regulator [Protofrankia]
MTPASRALTTAVSRPPARTPNIRLRNCREERGWSQEQLAMELRGFAVSREGREAGVTGNMICKWEKGDKKPSLRYQRLLGALFQRTSGELGFIENDTAGATGATNIVGTVGDIAAGPRPEHASGPSRPGAEQRPFLRLVAAAEDATTASPGARPPWERLSAALRQQAVATPSVVDSLSARTAGLFGLEERVPAHRLIERVTAHLAALSRLLEAAPRSAVRRALAVTAGETAALAGWLAFDMRNSAHARAYYHVAAEAAQEAGDDALLACVLGYESFQPSMNGRPDKACALLAEAQRHAERGGSPMTCAWLAAREAEEQAHQGDSDAALRALDRATDAFGQATPADDRVWTQFFDRSRLDGMKVTTFTRLRRPDAARATAFEGLRTTSPTTTKKRSLLLGAVAEVHIQQREIEQACQFAADALAIVAQTDFSLGLTRVLHIRDHLSPWRDVQAVRDLDEQLRVLI